MQEALCSTCQHLLTPDMLYCSYCGKRTAVQELSALPLGKQIGIYALSFFLPPLGLWPAITYLRNPQQPIKRVGIIALVLTIISLLISLYTSVLFYEQFTKTLAQYQTLGL